MKYDNIYVVCPANKVTGGPDALHQMVYYLKKLGRKASIVYYCEKKDQVAEIPFPYRIYLDSYKMFDEIDDDELNAVVLPEMYSFLSNKIKKAQVFIWWLSVNNNSYHTFLNKSIEIIKAVKNGKLYRINNIIEKKAYNFSNSNHIQLCASQYAYEYVREHVIENVYKCIEPISLKFLDCYSNWDKKLSKENVVLYNPAKCGEYVQKLIEQGGDFVFIPLKGYNQNELIDLYKRAKVFIDFGPFPGAERMPKEAVLYGCAIITGLHGASAYYEDVKIADKYKIDEEVSSIEEVLNKIAYCLKQYERIYHDFDEYRDMVLGLEKGFLRSLEILF